MSDSNFCFLSYIQASEETVRSPGIPISLRISQFVVIHAVKGFHWVEETVDVFLKFPYFVYDPMDVGDLISGSFAFSKSS